MVIESSKPLSTLWLLAKARHPDQVLFVKIGHFIHLFNEDVDTVSSTGLLLDRHIMDLGSGELFNVANANKFFKMWCMPDSILAEFLVEADNKGINYIFLRRLPAE
jgi:hypothetical protein